MTIVKEYIILGPDFDNCKGVTFNPDFGSYKGIHFRRCNGAMPSSCGEEGARIW